MAQPVWVLSVDLQAKTATFQSGMADAARAARGSFNDIGSGGKKMGEEMGRTTGEARHGVMMLGEEFGIHLPRGLTTFIASLGPVGAAMEAAFPFIAIILGATLLLEHLAKLHEAGEKLTDDQMKLGVAVQSAFNSLDEKMLKAEQRADELRGDHMGALHKELELIDRQSMEELVHSFAEVAKAADVVFADLTSHWYTFGIGADGAKHALDGFQLEYDALLAKGKSEEASGLLTGTLKQAEIILDAQKKMQKGVDTSSTDHSKETAQYNAAVAAHIALQKAGVGWTEKETEAQQALVDTLNAQVTVEQKVAALKAAEGHNATTSAHKADGKDAEERAKALAEAQQRGVDEEGRIIREANKAAEESIAASWRNSIEATEEGSAERLAVIDKAINAEEERGMEETATYRGLLVQLIQLVRKMGEEEAKLRADAGREDADNTQKMGELMLARHREQMDLINSATRQSEAQRIEDATKQANAEHALKVAVLNQEMADLNKGGKDYQNKLKALQDKETQMARQHENEITAIKDTAEKERNSRRLAAEQRAAEMTATGLTQSIMGHQTWARMITSFGDQAAEGLIRNSLMILFQQDKERLGDARKAATSAYATGLKYGGPAGPVLGPVLAAAAFAGVMAFEEGGIVPGTGRGDIVPAMLTPGEGVIPGGVMDNLSKMAREGNMGGGHHYHVSAPIHISASALDSEGMDRVLDRHGDKLQRHFENTLRKLNR